MIWLQDKKSYPDTLYNCCSFSDSFLWDYFLKSLPTNHFSLGIGIEIIFCRRREGIASNFILFAKSTSMLKNYFKTAWRNIIRTIGYSIPNVGLIAGNKKLYVKGAVSGSNIFKIFQYPFIDWNANTAFTNAEQQTKGIGIRKVLGASVRQVWLLLSKDFIILVLISRLIAAPVSFYFLHNWLLNYDYRINIGADVFVMGGLPCS